MTYITAWVVTLRGVRRYAFIFVLGALTTAALAPWHLIPILLLSFPAWAYSIAVSANSREALAAGWWFGFGFFVFGIYWIGNSFLVAGGHFSVLAPLAVLILAGGLAIFPMLVSWVVWRARLRRYELVFGLAFVWTLSEWIRGFLFTGFPWNSIGYAWSSFDAMNQFAALGGVHGLSYLTVALATLPILLLEGGLTNWSRWRPFILGISALVMVWVGGELRIPKGPVEVLEGVMLRLVQPNISQEDKWKIDLRDAHFARHLRMSSVSGRDRITHIIWPEVAVPYYLSRDPRRTRMIGSLVPTGGYVFVGSRRLTPIGHDPIEIWNSILVIDSDGRIVDKYDKSHLVPFGEYLPFRGLLRSIGVEKFAQGPLDFSAGLGSGVLSLNGLPPARALICYEIIFPQALGGEIARAGWLLNITNDAWFGHSTGPHQHFSMSRLRAVEQGLPLVRVANTGISAIIDPYGRTSKRLGLGEMGVLDGELPKALTGTPLYGRFGDFVLIPPMFLIVGAFLIFRCRPYRQ